MTDDVEGTGTPTDPWQLTTPPGSSAFEAYRDPDADPPALVVQVGKTQFRYHLSCIEDLHAMLTEYGDWMPLGSADEQKPRPTGRSRRGDVRPTTRSAAGTGSRRACAGGSATTSRPSSKRSASPRSSTTRATTECARSRRRSHGATQRHTPEASR